MKSQILLGDNEDLLQKLPETFARLCYIDPPFNTGRTQKRARIKATGGSGTTGEAAGNHGRNFVLIDKNPEAVAIMEERLAKFHPEVTGR